MMYLVCLMLTLMVCCALYLYHLSKRSELQPAENENGCSQKPNAAGLLLMEFSLLKTKAEFRQYKAKLEQEYQHQLEVLQKAPQEDETAIVRDTCELLLIGSCSVCADCSWEVRQKLAEPMRKAALIYAKIYSPSFPTAWIEKDLLDLSDGSQTGFMLPVCEQLQTLCQSRPQLREGIRAA